MQVGRKISFFSILFILFFFHDIQVSWFYDDNVSIPS